jgi:hypothetical protein
VSGTSVAAAVTAGAAAVLAGARPNATAVDLAGLLVGSARDVDNSTGGMLDLETAVLQEVVATPAVVSFAASARPAAQERTVRLHNLSTRTVGVTLEPSTGGRGVTVTAVTDRFELRSGGTAEVVLHADVPSSLDAPGAALGTIAVQVEGSPLFRIPWVLATPDREADLISQVELHATGGRVSDVTPAVVSFVAGTIEEGADPEVRPVDVLLVQLWRGRRLLGVLSTRREVLPGRYTFGLTGRGPGGELLRRGRYLIKLVARPEDGTRRQVESVEYVVS